MVINQYEEQILWDTGAQVSLVDEKWVAINKLEDHGHPLHEIFDRELVISFASGDELSHIGWMTFNLRSDKKGLNVPFSVTRVELDKPILGFNVIGDTKLRFSYPFSSMSCNVLSFHPCAVYHPTNNSKPQKGD